MVEVGAAVTLGLACGRVLFAGAGIAKLLRRAGARLARNAHNARFADLKCEF